MLLEIILSTLLGVFFGTLTGLTPGIHINLINIILINVITKFSNFNPLAPLSFIVSISITHTFVDFIPSIFLGAPDEDTFLSVLPGHEMLLNGKAHEATILTLVGSISGLIIILIFSPIFIKFIPFIFNQLKNILPFILIFISLYLIIREEHILSSLTIFLLSGIFGFGTLNSPINEPLLPLLTGLFGVSSLIISLKNKSKIPKQSIIKIKEIYIPKKTYFKSILGAIISAPLCSFLPGIGSGHAAVIGSEIFEQSKKGFIILLGSINTIVMGLSFVTLYTLGKTRTGSAVTINQIISPLTLSNLILILSITILSGILATPITLLISKYFSKNISKVNYSILSYIILSILLIVNLIFTNSLGILVLITATFLGVFTILSKVKRINLMGCLIIPTIIYYLSN